jgi:hypothetical protein
MRTSIWIAAGLAAARLFGQSFDEQHSRELAGNPWDVRFRLLIAGEPRPFHIGEQIPIVLEFSSVSPEKYKLNAASYDRGGRLYTEEYITERPDIRDPYADYFGAGVIGGMIGGLRGYPCSKPSRTGSS